MQGKSRLSLRIAVACLVLIEERGSVFGFVMSENCSSIRTTRRVVEILSLSRSPKSLLFDLTH